MYERDYIMRMVEAFSKIIARILGLKENGELHKAEALILDAYNTILKVDPESLHSFNQNDWEQFCHQRTPEELEMIAELLKLEGETKIDSGNPEGVCQLMLKSLELLRWVEKQSDTFSLSRFEKISLLEERLSGTDY
jgi:hypothetical protein